MLATVKRDRLPGEKLLTWEREKFLTYLTKFFHVFFPETPSQVLISEEFGVCKYTAKRLIHQARELYLEEIQNKLLD